ncbi:MAG: DMT family transporter [Anaerolineae bacterium]|nr:DMT family transporter [Anaerolineae bacterium]
MQKHSYPVGGILAAVFTPIFLGVAPVLGKTAINAGAQPFTVATLRTLAAVLLLWIAYLLFFRRYIYIYPAGLLGCVVVGIVNGIGSLFYYSGLGLVDAGLAQLLNGMYLVFAVVLVRITGERPNRRTLVRVGMALVALVLLTGFGGEAIDWWGVGLMVGSAIMFAGTFILSQNVLYEMPSPTVALYVLTTMGLVVSMVWLATGAQDVTAFADTAMMPILLLGISTALSRLAMFAGVKILGSMQTAILAIAEIAVALTLAFVFLGERLTTEQWIGVGILGLSILLVRPRDLTSRTFNAGRLVLFNIATQQFQWIAFHRAFGKEDAEGSDVMSELSAAELQSIRQMMGVDGKPMDPFPINPAGEYHVDLSAFLPDQPQSSEQPPSDDQSS